VIWTADGAQLASKKPMSKVKKSKRGMEISRKKYR